MATSNWEELVWASDHDRTSLSRAARRGTLRRLSQGLYTSAIDDDPAEVVRRNLRDIVAHELPGAVIADRSARAGGLPVGGKLYVVHPRTRPLELPGVTVIARPGPRGLECDIPLHGGAYIASEARTLLESLQRPGGRRLSRDEIEVWIDELSAAGARRLNSIRDLARTIADDLHSGPAFGILDALIAASLQTADAGVVTNERLAARTAGDGYDAARVELLATLVRRLSDRAPGGLVEQPDDATRRAMLPFYEAYFSNFIEGTEFTLEEAERIVFHGEIPDERPADAHDIIGTYSIVADPVRRALTASDPDELNTLLREWHSEVMGGRADKRPGEFKHRANRADTIEFVAPDLVDGTLRRGFEIGTGLIDPFQRAVYAMFMIAEVHPFLDGNGRVARIAMNAELSAGGLVRIIIPTVLRLNYIAALKAATLHGRFDALLAVAEFAQRYTARVDFRTRASAEAVLTATNALRDPYEAEQAGVRLELP
ncbi:MAG: Fic family protein [Ilumatobacteraceae bacterium]